MREDTALVVFQDKRIRRRWYSGEWFYSVVDIVGVLTDSPTPRQYWGKVKDREFMALELSPIWVQLKLPAEDGKLRFTDCVHTKNAFRLIQSIPSKKAEPFKQWLAQLAQDRIREIENPELAQDRIKEYYELKGYPKEWIDKRLRGIAIRQELTGEWKNRGVVEEKEFAILTNEISKATFGKTVVSTKNLSDCRRRTRIYETT
ncbi:MAG: BRO family protein [archaeon]